MKIDPKFRPELCVSTDETRYQIMDPYLDTKAKRLVATDGHMLVAVPVEVSEDESSGYVSRFLLRLARRWFRRERPAGERVEIVDGNVPGGPSYPTDHARGSGFPDWRAAVPKRTRGTPGTVTIGLDAVYLKEIALALGGEDRPGGCQVTLTIDVVDLGTPLLVQSEGAPEAVAALMPVGGGGLTGGVRFDPAEPPAPEELRAQVYDAVKYALDRVQEDADFGYHSGFGTEVFHRLVKAEAAHLGRPLKEVEAQRRKTAWRGEPRVEQLRKRVAELEASR